MRHQKSPMKKAPQFAWRLYTAQNPSQMCEHGVNERLHAREYRCKQGDHALKPKCECPHARPMHAGRRKAELLVSLYMLPTRSRWGDSIRAALCRLVTTSGRCNTIWITASECAPVWCFVRDPDACRNLFINATAQLNPKARVIQCGGGLSPPCAEYACIKAPYRRGLFAPSRG